MANPNPRPEFAELCVMIGQWEAASESAADFAGRILAFIASHPSINELVPKDAEVGRQVMAATPRSD
jgi:hypothetical protein